ncbi:MAG: 3-oxoacyl-[acyl-carrier-protein] reductase [Negativicutes bacterium]|jgi:3-oxoacyl-[acyl-carrier protein] reductase
MRLDNKVAVVTGGSRGIGRAVVAQLAGQGANIVINYAGNIGAAEESKRVAEALGVEVLLFKGDVSDATACEAMIAATVEKFGRIDILVNNAGITRDNLLMRMKQEEWDAVINTNLTGVYNCCKAVVKPMMKQRSGCIINMTSVIGQIGNAGQANYAAAKAGVIGLTKSLAKELAARNIRVNAIAPGFISTDMTAELNEKVVEQLVSQIPLARLGKADDVAYIAGFLASDFASYITGQVINVDGGMVM